MWKIFKFLFSFPKFNPSASWNYIINSSISSLSLILPFYTKPKLCLLNFLISLINHILALCFALFHSTFHTSIASMIFVPLLRMPQNLLIKFGIKIPNFYCRPKIHGWFYLCILLQHFQLNWVSAMWLAHS